MLGGVVTFFISSINLTTTLYIISIYKSMLFINIFDIYLYFICLFIYIID